MLKVSLIVCVSLVFGTTAKPYKPWNELEDEAFQDTVMSIDDKGKMSWVVETEPPEDMDELHYDIDPRMRIWKSMTGREQDKEPLKAEEDLDELYHPSVADLKIQIQNLYFLPAADNEAEPEEVADIKYKEPEEDRDDIYHTVFSDVASEEPEQDWDKVDNKAMEEMHGYLVPLMAGSKAGAEVQVSYSEPEKDEDDLYHHDDQQSPVQMEVLRHEVRVENKVRVHLQPEEDMDDLYHKDPLQLIPYQDDSQVAAPVVDLLSQRKHSEPEEDLDDLYHQ